MTSPFDPKKSAAAAPRAQGPSKHHPKLSAKPRTLRIESIAAGGAGVARDSGRAVFVQRTAPGDLVEASVEARGGTLQARVLRLVERGPGRVEPTCPFVEECGGCDLMHLSADAQRDAHRAIVEDALRRTAGLTSLPEIVARIVHAPVPFGSAAHDAPPAQTDHASSPDRADHASSSIAHAAQESSVIEGLPSPLGTSSQPRAALAYRTRARFFARVERKRPMVGYRAGGSHSIVAIDHCAVLVPPLDALLAELPALLEGATGDGEISVALGENARPVVDVAWRGALPAEVWARLDQKTKPTSTTDPTTLTSAWAGARVWLDGATTPAIFGDPRPVITGADGRPLIVAAGGFAQPSEQAATALARHAADLVHKSSKGGEPIGSIVELYAGSGTLSILLAPLASKFVAVESQEDAVRAARQNLEARGIEAKVVCADASTHDPGRADVVVLDPPRTGAKSAAERIAASPARAVVYVACEPTTMARDVAILTAAGFTLTDVETIEIFPQTSHVETIVRLARGKR